ncbi:sperm flagellar protein 1 isoform X1 [Alligator mississippiensis]|uniref:sperm flagellar protein 1 isoform X1 n=1 Tax=Alligator mississippiensis TaxID=8496 RepID=UPI002877A687|nr:sperm flagellar protein 1 isoform X1 [Alligator mississippiensis]
MANGELDEESLQDLYSWVDAIPLSRPKKNITRDFSDGVLAAEVVKFYFPKMVEMHNYVPANSTQQKLSNWAHLNRKVLARLNFSIPEDVVRKVVQCVPGAVELVLVPLRQRIEEKQRKSKDLAWRSALDENSSPETDPGDQPSAAARDSALVKQEGEGYLSKPKANAAGIYQESSKAERTAKAQPGYAQALQGDPRAHLQLAEREQALLVARETVQILQMKVRRLEQLVHLKDIRIDDLTRRLQQKEQK